MAPTNEQERIDECKPMLDALNDQLKNFSSVLEQVKEAGKRLQNNERGFGHRQFAEKIGNIGYEDEKRKCMEAMRDAIQKYQKDGNHAAFEKEIKKLHDKYYKNGKHQSVGSSFDRTVTLCVAKSAEINHSKNEKRPEQAKGHKIEEPPISRKPSR